MILVTFIIPVYNTSLYLEKCIKSVMSQAEITGLCEVIVVNDGSTDNSGEILECLKNKYPNLNIITQANKGLGAARNAALREAKGKYIFFLDSDDYLLENSLFQLLESLTKEDYDIVCLDGATVIDGYEKQEGRNRYRYNKVITGAKYLQENNLKGGYWYVFSFAFMKKYHLWMPEGIYHEDELFLPKAFTLANRVTFKNIPAYGYLIRHNSITNQPDNLHRERKMKDALFVIDELIRFKEETPLSDDQLRGLNRKIYLLASDVIINVIRFQMSKEFTYQLIDHLREKSLFPLNRVGYSWKHDFFRCVFFHESIVFTASKLNFVRKGLSTALRLKH